MAAASVCGWWKIVLVLVLVMLSCCMVEVFGCLEDEKIALLKLKDDVINHHQNASLLKSWSTDDCCRWEGVTCDVFSKRIINLNMATFKVFGLESEGWFLEASLFQPFEELQNLTIQHRMLQGLQGPLKLTKLQLLDLSSNEISRVPLLGELPSLKYLDLSYNQISDGFEELTNLRNLEILKLDSNIFPGGEIPPSIWVLTSLKMLGLSENSLNGSLPKGLCAFKNLQELDLSYNEFEGVIPTCLSNLKNLQKLDLSINEFEGVIPTCLRNLTSLRHLDLYGNKFSGTIPSNVFSSLNSLEYVSLSYNHFDGVFSFNSFLNNSKLEVFELQNLNPKLIIDTENTKLKHPIFQLKILRLSNCGVIPIILLSQFDLRYVDLSNNGFIGEFPSWLLTNNSRLESLSLRNNSLTGRLALQLDSYNPYLISLDVSMNQVAGEIPTFIGSIFPNLTYLSISRNTIEGSIPSSIENMSKLYKLDLSNNFLSGEIPGGLFTRCEELTYLKLDSNNLSGDITHGPLKTLRLLFGGVRFFDISNNSISGRFPDWILELSALSTLVMSKNHFEGKLPTSFCNLTKLKLLDLSYNNFHDTLPLCTNLSSMKFLHLQGNMFHGPLPTSLSWSSYIVTLDVRDNNFSGLIPSWISSLSSLTFLFLSRNFFHGSIPSELCQLENLNILDLAANNLSGNVPPCLSHIPFGKNELFDFIFYIRDGGVMRSFESSSYESQLHRYTYQESIRTTYVQEEVQFITKSMSESYKGSILGFMSVIDLSFNNLTGPIPLDIGKWDMVYSLNLSYNNFNGSIPWTLSKLKALESLDLSHNMLSGEIPSEITELNFLSVFSVAYNNLSGPTPTTRQFATFNASSYEGNPLLYGLPLDKNCNGRSPPSQHAKPSSEREPNDFSFKTTFLFSFLGSFIVSCIGAFVFFYFNSNVPEIFLEWIGIERVPPHRRTVELPWKWNK